MATTIAKLDVMLGLDATGFIRGSDRASAKVNDLKTTIGGAAKSGIASLASLGLKFAGVFGAIETGKAIVQLGMDAETSAAQFETLLGSTEKAKDLLGELEQFTAATPFDLKSVEQGAKNLLAFGFSTSETMDALHTLGDVAAATGKPLQDFVNIFGKVRATGRVELETLNQLAERGVPIYDRLKTQLGVTGDELRKLVSSGKLGFEDIEQVLKGMTGEGGVFKDGMVKQSDTLAGKWSTFVDKAKEVGKAIAEDIVPHLKQMLDLAGTVLGVFSDMVGNLKISAALATGGIDAANKEAQDQVVEKRLRKEIAAWKEWRKEVKAGNAEMRRIGEHAGQAFNVMADLGQLAFQQFENQNRKGDAGQAGALFGNFFDVGLMGFQQLNEARKSALAPLITDLQEVLTMKKSINEGIGAVRRRSVAGFSAQLSAGEKRNLELQREQVNLLAQGNQLLAALENAVADINVIQHRF